MNDNEIWEDRMERVGHSATVHPYAFIIKLVLVFLLLGVTFTVIGFFAGWFRTAVNVISPANVTQQYALAFQDYNALKATATNVCAVTAAEKSLQKGSEAFNQRETERLGYITNYDRIKAQYEARMANIFEANKVKPTQLPFIAPPLVDMENQVC